MKPVPRVAGPHPLLYLAAIVLVPLSTNAQQAPPADHANHIHQLPVLVDGAKTPELIPDELAYKHYILTITEHRDATVEDVRRRESRILPVRLSQRDSIALVNALVGVREQLDDIENARSSGNVDPQALRSLWESVMAAARDRLRHSITPEGLARLDAFIRDRVKPAIVIYGE